MKTQKSPAGQSKGNPVKQDKDRRKLIGKQILRLLADGNRYTAVQLNELTGGCDARKRISELRRRGVPIVGEMAGNDQYAVKVYYLESVEDAAQ